MYIKEVKCQLLIKHIKISNIVIKNNSKFKQLKLKVWCRLHIPFRILL